MTSRKNSSAAYDELLATVARFARDGGLMNVNREAIRIVRLCPDDRLGLREIEATLMSRGASARVAMHVGDGQHLAVAAIRPPSRSGADSRSTAFPGRRARELREWAPSPPELA